MVLILLQFVFTMQLGLQRKHFFVFLLTKLAHNPSLIFLRFAQGFELIFTGLCNLWTLLQCGWGLHRRKALWGPLAGLILKVLSFLYLIYKICLKFALSIVSVIFLKFQLSLNLLRFLLIKSCLLEGLFPFSLARHNSDLSNSFYLVPRKLFTFLRLIIARFV